MKKKNKILLNLIICATAIALVSSSVVLPRYILKSNAEKNYNTVTEVPTDFYSGPSEAVVKNASKQLSNYQKLQLISGLWESEISTASDSETNISELDAKDLAISKLISLSSDGLYPINVDSDYQKWYSWEASAYKAVDTTFRTYAAIYWDVTFTKYDNSESHRIIITENGDVLFANAASNTDTKSFGNFSPKLENIGYLFINDDIYGTSDENTNIVQITPLPDNIITENENLSSDNIDSTNKSLPSENSNPNDSTSTSQTTIMLSSAENYIADLPNFEINGGAHFADTSGDDPLTGTFIYGSENDNYTFVLIFSESQN